MKRSFELSVTLCDALVIVLMLLKSSKVSVQAIQRHRDIILTARNGSLSSPNYPKIYPKQIEWTWIIDASQYTVILEIEELDLYRCYLVDPAYEDCTRYDHVTIRGHGMYCNGIKPEKVITFLPWTKILIKFKSLYAREECRGSGFKAYYRLVMETTTAVPKTLAPTYLTDKHKTENDKEILEVSIPIVFGIVIVAIFLIVLIIWCYRKKSNNRPSPRGGDRNARALEARNRLLVEAEQNRDRGGRQAQDEAAITYSDLLRNDTQFNASVPLNIGPPPSYDEIGRNDTSNRSHNVESPPSYETAMSEPTPARPERSIPTAIGVHVTSDSPRGHTAAEGDSGSRLLNQLQPNVPNEDSSTERSEVFV